MNNYLNKFEIVALCFAGVAVIVMGIMVVRGQDPFDPFWQGPSQANQLLKPDR
jgi:hypothetical protein